MNKKISIFQIISHIIIIVLIFMMLYPFFMLVASAFKSDYGFVESKWFLSFPLRINNIVIAFTNTWYYIINTVIVAFAGTLGMLILGTLSAYAFARLNFRAKKQLFFMVIALMMIPGVLTLVPTFMLYKNIGLHDNILVLILPQMIGGSVGSLMLFRSFFEGLPEDVFEAARIDGAGELVTYFKICLPLSMPIIGTLTISQIFAIWSDYMWPMLTITTDRKLTISAGLFVKFAQTFSNNVPIQFAGYLVSSVPLILIFVFFNKYYVEGLASSGLKL